MPILCAQTHDDAYEADALISGCVGKFCFLFGGLSHKKGTEIRIRLLEFQVDSIYTISLVTVGFCFSPLFIEKSHVKLRIIIKLYEYKINDLI